METRYAESKAWVKIIVRDSDEWKDNQEELRLLKYPQYTKLSTNLTQPLITSPRSIHRNRKALWPVESCRHLTRQRTRRKCRIPLFQTVVKTGCYWPKKKKKQRWDDCSRVKHVGVNPLIEFANICPRKDKPFNKYLRNRKNI